MTNTNTNPNVPGTTHYIYSCQLGKIQVSPLGIFRDTICESQVKQKVIDGNPISYENANSVDNLWGQCSKCGEGKFNKCGEKECLKLGGSTDSEKSQCVYNKEGVNECWPKYPPGIDFVGDLGNVPSSKHTFENTCGICGKGSNSCDKLECTYMGDCGNFDEGVSTLGGIVGGGVIGAISAAGAYHFGPGYLKAILSLGKYNVPLAESVKVSLGKTGTFVAEQVAAGVITNQLGSALGESDGKKVYQNGEAYYITGNDAEGAEVIYTAEKQNE